MNEEIKLITMGKMKMNEDIINNNDWLGALLLLFMLNQSDTHDTIVVLQQGNKNH